MSWAQPFPRTWMLRPSRDILRAPWFCGKGDTTEWTAEAEEEGLSITDIFSYQKKATRGDGTRTPAKAKAATRRKRTKK